MGCVPECSEIQLGDFLCRASAGLPGKGVAKRNQEKPAHFCFTEGFFSGFEHLFCQALRTPCQVAEPWVAQDISACTEL